MIKLNHEESVELMLLFICSQIASLVVVNGGLSEGSKDEVVNQMESISKLISLDKVKAELVH